MHFRRNAQLRWEKSAVIEEAQAMLSGTAGTAIYPYWPQRPAWVYVNELAHADIATLVRLAQRQTTSHPASWIYARAFLAGEVLRVTSTGRDLIDVQRALIPLELELLASGSPQDLTPGMLVRLATRALTAAGL